MAKREVEKTKIEVIVIRVGIQNRLMTIADWSELDPTEKIDLINSENLSFFADDDEIPLADVLAALRAQGGD